MIVNVITRTSNREAYFNACRQSVLSQTKVEDINWIVGSDRECPYYPEAIRVYKDIRVPVGIPVGMYHAPHNLYLNTLQEYVREGWIMALDDDDKFSSPKSVQRIINAIDNENQLLVWKVKILPHWIVPSHSFGKLITAGDFSGIGMCWHSKNKPDWGNLSYGDYRAAWQLLQKGLQVKWIDMVLTETQAGAHNGR